MSRAIHQRLPFRQKELMVVAQRHLEDFGVIPTNEFLRAALGLKSHGSIYDLLRGLERRGIILRRPQSAPQSENKHTARRVNRRPILSHVHSTVPQSSRDETKQVIR